jgi:YbbR domain-containing protein
MSDMFRWLATNLRTFLLAFALALVVWVTAVTAANPDQTLTYPGPIPIEFIGQDPSLVMTGTVIKQVQVSLRAPQSIWQTLTSGEVPIHAIVDLTGVKAGIHTVAVQIQITTQPVRIISINPSKFDLSLEQLVTMTLPVEVSYTGQPAVGYKAGNVVLDPAVVAVSGPQSFVAQVKHIRAALDVTNSRQNIDVTLPISAETENGVVVSGITVQPNSVHVSLPIAQQGGYRDLAVKVMITGKLASGYRLNNITAAPLTVTVFSENIPLIESLPGFLETSTLDISGASSNINSQLSLNLPNGVLLIGDQAVSVQIEVVPIEDSRPVAFRTVEVIGLEPGVNAVISPSTVDVILAGPLPVLNSLLPDDVHVRVDLTGLGVGTYQLIPDVVVAGLGVTVQSILPGTVEVTIAKGTPTPPVPTVTTTPAATPTK